MTPKQRGPGQFGNTSRGHQSNRINSIRRGGNPHVGRGKPEKGCLGFVLVLCVAVPAAAVMVAQVVERM